MKKISIIIVLLFLAHLATAQSFNFFPSYPYTAAAGGGVTVPAPDLMQYLSAGQAGVNNATTWEGASKTAGNCTFGGGGSGMSYVTGPETSPVSNSASHLNGAAYGAFTGIAFKNVPRTFSFFMRAATGSNWRIFGNITVASGTVPVFILNANAPGLIDFAGNVAQSTTAIGNNVWTMCTLTIDASGNWVWYINAVVAGSGTLNTVNLTSNLLSAGVSTATDLDYYPGDLGYINCWSQVLTAGQIAQLKTDNLAGLPY